MSSYNQNIPVITNTMLQSQSQCKANFQAINNVFSENHTPLNQDLEGTHSTLVFQENNGVDPATGADEIGLYTKLVGGKPVLFYRPHNNATPIQLTADSIDTDITKLDQYTFMAGPFRVYIGRIPNATNGQVKALTPSSTIIYVQTTAMYTWTPFSLPTPTIGIITGSGFTVKFNPTSIPFVNLNYFAIGV